MGIKQVITDRMMRLKLIAAVEGICFIVLVVVAVPMKYFFDLPELASEMGLIHGITFLLYIIQVVQTGIEFRWGVGRTLLAIVASLIPFGPFFVIRRMLPNIKMIDVSKKP